MVAGTAYLLITHEGTTLMQASGDYTHFDKTVIPIPEHPSTQAELRYSIGVYNIEMWSARVGTESKAGDGTPIPRWRVTAWPNIKNITSDTTRINDPLIGYTRGRIPLEKEGTISWYIIPFEVSDSDTKDSLQYMGLFSWPGSGPMQFHDEVLVGNYVFQAARKNTDGTVTVRYTESGAPDSPTVPLTYETLPENVVEFLTLSRDGTSLLEEKRTREPKPAFR